MYMHEGLNLELIHVTKNSLHHEGTLLECLAMHVCTLLASQHGPAHMPYWDPS